MIYCSMVARYYPLKLQVLCKFKLLIRMVVPEEGVEPTRPCDQWILSPPRLPFRHSGVRIS
jgi:hypothetical protein